MFYRRIFIEHLKALHWMMLVFFPLYKIALLPCFNSYWQENKFFLCLIKHHPYRGMVEWVYSYSLSLTHGAESFLRSCQLCSYSRTSQRFMEPEGSLPPSQEPSIGPYPKPDRSNPYHPILYL
jgi:hypothetical protein